jgi:CYTH domain-containing protein
LNKIRNLEIAMIETKDGLEIERKWVYTGDLCGLLAPMDSTGRRYIRHVYTQNFRFTATNLCGESYYTMSKKALTDAGELVRKEWETEIPLWVYTAVLQENPQAPTISKLRYACRHYTNKEPLEIEVDVFGGDLILIEIEFDSLVKANEFDITKILPHTREVTSDSRYNNFNLAKDGIPK